MGDELPEAEQRISDWPVDVAMMADLYDRIGVLIQVTSGAKPSDFPPHPRPVTAFQRARINNNRAHHLDLVGRLTPP